MRPLIAHHAWSPRVHDHDPAVHGAVAGIPISLAVAPGALLFGAAPGTPAPADGLVFPALPAAAPIGTGAVEPCSAPGLVGGARCGVFRVPEDRAEPAAAGRTVDIAFVILEALEGVDSSCIAARGGT